MPTSERTPLLWDYNSGQISDTERYQRFRDYALEPPPAPPRELPRAKNRDCGDDVHAQFCALVGCPPSNAPAGYKHRLNDKSLYGRATHLLRRQGRTYAFSASVSNTLLLVQVVLGAALTGLGASNSPGWVITLFGATNTVIAGLVAYLKSRGQPMRARMYRDDLERVVDEIENSEIMWLGISQGVHGYDDIDTDGEVTVRSEVARLTRLYDRAVRNNTMNNPDMYMAGQIDNGSRAGLRNRGPQMTNVALPAVMPAPETEAAPAAPAPAPVAPAPVATDPDASPASANIKPKEESKKDETADPKPESSNSATGSSEDKGKAPESTPPAPAPQPPAAAPPPAATPVAEDPDAAPATKAKFTKKAESSDTPKKVQGDEY